LSGDVQTKIRPVILNVNGTEVNVLTTLRQQEAQRRLDQFIQEGRRSLEEHSASYNITGICRKSSSSNSSSRRRKGSSRKKSASKGASVISAVLNDIPIMAGAIKEAGSQKTVSLEALPVEVRRQLLAACQEKMPNVADDDLVKSLLENAIVAVPAS
jgi:hypothetical protein